MNTTTLKHIILSIFFIGGSLSAFAQIQAQKATITFTIDEVGDVISETTKKYDASNWNYLNQTVGTNKNVYKHELIKNLPKYVVKDFSYSENPDERTTTVKAKVQGMLRINEKGKWEADLDTKDPQITKIDERNYLAMAEGVTLKITLPPGTNDSKIEANRYGKATLTYSADTGGSTGGKVMMYGGLLLALAGGGLLFMQMKKGKAGANITNIPYRPVEDGRPQGRVTSGEKGEHE